jgi:multiple sugar transport system substrate-binding protein
MAMPKISRRGVLSGGLGLAAVGTLARPYIANAQAKTAVCWIGQGFVQQEDVAMKQVCDDYMKASGNKLDYSIMPFMALNQKIISALTSGDVPDLFFHDAPENFLPQNAWDDKLVDVSDVVEEYKSQLSETALLASSFYNSVTKRRSFYLAPVKQACAPFHIWGDLVTKAGFKLADAPKTWDAFWEFFSRCRRSCAPRGCVSSMASACRSLPSDRMTATTCSLIF